MCFSICQGPERNRPLPLPRAGWRLRLGADPGNPSARRQGATTNQRRLRQLRHKVGHLFSYQSFRVETARASAILYDIARARKNSVRVRERLRNKTMHV